MAVEFLNPIGSGGFGTVYEALLDGASGLVAVKQLRNPLSHEGDLARFKREVKIQSSLKHENILPVLHCDLDCDQPWFASPLAQCTLVDEIPTIRFQQDRLINIFGQILEGVRYAHENNVIHRDLKPENILIFPKDNVKIADFGLGKMLDTHTFSTTLTHTNQVLGTLYYMAPEQMKSLKEVDARADIFSLGKILYVMLTGEDPFPVLDSDLLDDTYLHIVLRCTEFRVERRFQTVADLIAEFAETDQQLYRDNSELNHERVALLLARQPTKEATVELIRIFSANQDDDDLYRKFFPRLTDGFLAAALLSEEKRFKNCLHVYDSCVSGPLVFEYCDVVADFYQEVFFKSQDTEIRSLILARLLELGVSHNRWHVQGVFRTILGQIRDRTTGLAAVSVIHDHPLEVSALCGDLFSVNLMSVIRDAVKEHCVVDDLPF